MPPKNEKKRQLKRQEMLRSAYKKDADGSCKTLFQQPKKK